MTSNRPKDSDYAKQADAGSNDCQSSDDSFSFRAPRQKGHGSHHRNDSRQTISTTGYPKQSPGFSTASASKSSIHDTPRGNSTPGTPFRKGPIASAGTPSSRSAAAIEKVFKDMENKKKASPDSSKVLVAEKRKTVVVVGDSDSDSVEDTDVSTDIEPTESPTKATFSEGPIPLSTESSKSSMNSLFSDLSLSSSQSSFESMSTQRMYAKPSMTPKSQPVQPTSRLGNANAPTFVADVFSSGPSPNLHAAHRKTPKTADAQPPMPNSEPNLPAQPTPKAVLSFANSLFGTDLAETVIAHSDEIQRLFDDNQIEWGTQYELARGVTTGTWAWEDVRARVKSFIGNNELMASKVFAIMLERPSLANANLGLWKELDREQAAIAENKGRGLGLMGEWQGSSNWYGGQIQQLARVVKDDKSYKIVLEAMRRDRSHRFARFYGSRRLLQLKIPEDLLKNENSKLRSFLINKFVLCGRIFVPFHSKDDHVYLVETNETRGRTAQHWCSDQSLMPFRDFINWHNPLVQEKNYNQVISKYVTRFALGLSTSVPVLEFKEESIIFIDDLTSSEWPSGKKNPPANMLMTDGCGFLNHAALHAIVKYLDYESLPAGVQGRIDGSKGFWVLHPTDQSTEPKIWIRTSQDKIRNSSFDRAHRVFDLLGPSRPSAPIALTSQSIINVFSNGIPDTTLERMLEEGLEKEIGPLLEWKKPYAMVFLWDAINKLGNISGSRTQRLSTAFNRALGLQGRDWGHDSVSSDIVDIPAIDEPAATYTGRNKYSGTPRVLHESAMELIQAGFHPATNPELHLKMEYIIKCAIDSSVSKYRIPIEESLGAFIVPDPTGMLKEGEIYYRFSRPRRDPRTSMLVHVLEGDVLLGRYPIRLPSDMQKVKAVNIRELDKWPDVVIVSTQGKRSIASLLADGDMDGDELIVIWDLIIVGNFQNKPFTNPPAEFLKNNFNRDIETVEAFCRRAGLLSEREANEAFQEILIANLTESNVGLYSMMHEKSVIMYGYDHEHSIRLAYIFATLLDANKSGYRLKPSLLQIDLKRYGNTSAANLEAPRSKDILDILRKAGQRKGGELLKRYESIEAKASQDKDLSLPYDTAIDYSHKAFDRGVDIFSKEIKNIRDHVDAAHKMWAKAVSSSKGAQESPTKPAKNTKRKSSKKTDGDDVSLASARAYAQPLEDLCLTPNLEEVKASYAYKISQSFGFSVAFQELCRIKARASPGGHAPNLRIFDEAKSFSSSFLRALNRCEDEFGRA